MIDLTITDKERKVFLQIIRAYHRITPLPKKGVWKEFSCNDIWIRMVEQVMVVGGSSGQARFAAKGSLKTLLHFDSLKQISDDALLHTINTVLRRAGVRYAGRDYKSCAKSKALAHNYRFLCEYSNGPTGLLQDLSDYSGTEAEVDRVGFLMKHLKFMKNKSARDFLMNMGMNQHTLALDIRIQNIFWHAHIPFPSAGQLNSIKVYSETEKQIIEKVCRPLKILPVTFDRILYYNYTKIMRSDYLMACLFQ